MSVAKPGNGEVDSASGFSLPSALTLIPRLWNSIDQPGLRERVQRRLHVVGPRADEVDRAAGDPRGAGIAAGLDAVGHDFIFGAVQALDAVDDQVRRADALDLRAHRDQQVAEVDDLGLARGVEQLRFALGEHRRHHRILGRSDRHHREAEVAAGQPALGRARLHIAGGELDLRAHAFERLQVQVDRPVADRAAAGQRHRRFARRAPASGRAPAPTRASCGPCRRARRSRRSRPPGASSCARYSPFLTPATWVETPSWLSRWLKVSTSASRGRLVERQLLFGQQRARHQGQRRILRAADRDFAVEAVAALDPDAVHGRGLAGTAPLPCKGAGEGGGAQRRPNALCGAQSPSAALSRFITSPQPPPKERESFTPSPACTAAGAGSRARSRSPGVTLVSATS